MAKTVELILNIDVNKSMNSLLGIRKEMKEVQKAMEDAASTNNQVAYEKLSKRFVELREASQDMNAALQPMHGHVSKVAQGFTQVAAIGQNLAVVFGSDKKSAEELFKTFAKAQAITNVVTGFAQLSDLLPKVAVSIRVVGTAIKAALGPIGLIIIGVTAIATGIYLLMTRMTDFEKSMEKFNEAQLKAVDSSAKEIASLNILKERLKDTNISQEKRKELVSELVKKYPEYLSKMDEEKILAGDLTDVFDKLTVAIQKKALVSALEEEIAENYKTIMQDQIELTKRQESGMSDLTKGLLATAPVLAGVVALWGEYKEYDLETEIRDTKLETNAFTRVLAEQLNQIDKNVKSTDDTTKKTKQATKALKEFKAELNLTIFVEQTFNTTIDESNRKIAELNDNLKQGTISLDEWRTGYVKQMDIIEQARKLESIYNSEWGKSWSDRLTKEMSSAKTDEERYKISAFYWKEYNQAIKDGEVLYNQFVEKQSQGNEELFKWWNTLEPLQANLIKLYQKELNITNETNDARRKAAEESGEIVQKRLEDEEAAIDEWRDEYWSKRKEDEQLEKEHQDALLDLRDRGFQATANLMGALSDLYTQQMNMELEAAGNNEQKKDAIRKRYAVKRQAAAVSEATISGALAVMQIWRAEATGNAIADAIIKGVLTAGVLLNTATQISTINSQKFAFGGVVPGAGGDDSVSAKLTPGEGVLNKSAMAAIGTDNLNRLNRGEGMVQRVVVVESDITRTQKNVNRVQVRSSLSKINK